MLSRYEVLTKVRAALEKMGILGAARYLYRIRHFFYHMKTSYWSKRRKKGYVDARFTRLKELKDIHFGERCFIVCTGPSLTLNDVERLKNEVTFSMNSIYMLFDKTDWRPTYYALQDSQVYQIMGEAIERYGLKNVFIGDNVIGDHNGNVTDDILPYPLEPFNHWYYNRKTFYTEFSDDIYAAVNDGTTVTFSLMQIAVYMGFKEIYLLGCDCDYSGTVRHFNDYKYEDRKKGPVEPDMIAAYQVAKEYCDNHGIKIYNATRGGKLEVFDRVDFDELMGNKQTEDSK